MAKLRMYTKSLFRVRAARTSAFTQSINAKTGVKRDSVSSSEEGDVTKPGKRLN